MQYNIQINTNQYFYYLFIFSPTLSLSFHLSLIWIFLFSCIYPLKLTIIVYFIFSVFMYFFFLNILCDQNFLHFCTYLFVCPRFLCSLAHIIRLKLSTCFFIHLLHISGMYLPVIIYVTILWSFISVSYTHLDVYKRQVAHQVL